MDKSKVLLVGHGRVGKAIARMLGPDMHGLIGRNDIIPEHIQGPIYVCTTNDALASVIDRAPPGRRPDLVLFQNGWLLPLLEGAGLGQVTQVALYMAAAPDGSAKDGFRTVVSGRWAEHVACTLARGGVTCTAVKEAQLCVALAEKMLWASIFWMMSAALGGKKVGAIVEEHAGEVAALVDELLPLLREQLEAAGSTRSGAAEAAERLRDHGPVLEGLIAYSISIAEAVPSKEMALAEFNWRNGALLTMRATELHLSWLTRALGPGDERLSSLEKRTRK